MDNLESDELPLVTEAERLKIMMSDNGAHFADVLYYQRYYNKFTRDYKPAESNRKNKDSVEKATAEKIFLVLLKHK